jgi:hypothetical protein
MIDFQMKHESMEIPVANSNWLETADMVALLLQWPLRADFESQHGKEMFDTFIAAVGKVLVYSNLIRCS